MLNAKLTDNFHSMRLVLTNSAGDALTLHVGASIRVTSRQMVRNAAMLRTMNQLAKALFDYVTAPGNATYGERMRALQSLAAQSASFGSLVTSLGGRS